MAVSSYNVVQEWDSEENVWVTYVPALDFSSTYGDPKEKAIENTREAILAYVEAAAKEGLHIPSGQPEAELVCIDIQAA